MFTDDQMAEFHEKFEDLPTLHEAAHGDAVALATQTTWNMALHTCLTDMYAQALKTSTAFDMGLLDDASLDNADSVIEVIEEVIGDAWYAHDNGFVHERTKEFIAAGAVALAYILHIDQDAEAIIDEVYNMMIDRQRKYGTGNILRRTELGILVRMEDKLSRLANGVQDFDDDAWIDGFYDIIGYSLIAMMLHRNVFLLPLAP